MMRTTGMKIAIAMAAAFFLAGCASQDEQDEQADESTQDVNQAVRDFIELRELEELDALKSRTMAGSNSMTASSSTAVAARSTWSNSPGAVMS